MNQLLKIAIFLFLSMPLIAIAQNREIDSLRQELKKATKEKDKKSIEGELANALVFVDPPQSIKLNLEILPYFKKSKDTSAVMSVLNALGIANAITGDASESEKRFLEKLSLAREIGDSITVAGTYSSLGNVYQNAGNFQKALKYYNSSMIIFEHEKHEAGLSNVYSNLGNTYKSLGQMQNSLDAYFKALKMSEKIKKGTGTILTNIGNVFADMDESVKAEIYFKKAIEEFHKDGNEYYEAWGTSNLASIYLDTKKYKKAEKLYLKAMAMHGKQGDMEGVAHSEHSLGLIRLGLKKYEEAMVYFKSSLEKYKALEIPFEVGKNYIDMAEVESERGNLALSASYIEDAVKLKEYFPYDNELKILYKKYAEVQKWKGNYKEALKYYELYSEVNDSISGLESKRAIAEKEAKYQNDKKQKENEILKQKNKVKEEENLRQKERTNILIFSGITGGILLFLVIFVLIRSNRIKQRSNKLLQDQNEKISHQKEIIEEKNKDITDSINYAQNIQQAILPDIATARQVLGDSFILFMPRDIVSGDFYWMHKMDNGDVFFAVADCTGHGVPGAFMSMMGNDMLNKIIIDHGISDPGKALSELNKEVKKALAKNVSADKMRDGMDITLCKLNASRSKIQFASAMRSFYQVGAINLDEHKGDKNPIGGNTESNFSFSTQTVEVVRGDCIYVTTDGFADQFGGTEGKKFMSKNLKELFIQSRLLSMEEQHKILSDSFRKWKGAYEQIDDVTVMGIRI